MNILSLCAPLAAAALLGACASTSMSGMAKVDNASLPEAVRVPAGHRHLMSAKGTGELTYECREKSAAAGQYEWVFVAPMAALVSPDGRTVGRYYGGPTWESNDGSKVTGKQVATAPAKPGSIPLQLVKADPATGSGSMSSVAYIQRVNTEGGVAPATACDAGVKGSKQVVKYAADYVFYAR